jgi:hypothetical protein
MPLLGTLLRIVTGKSPWKSFESRYLYLFMLQVILTACKQFLNSPGRLASAAFSVTAEELWCCASLFSVWCLDETGQAPPTNYVIETREIRLFCLLHQPLFGQIVNKLDDFYSVWQKSRVIHVTIARNFKVHFLKDSSLYQRNYNAKNYVYFSYVYQRIFRFHKYF